MKLYLKKIREGYLNKVNEMAGVLISLVNNNEASPSDIFFNTGDYIDCQIIGNLYNSPVFQNHLKKKLCDECPAIRAVDNNDIEIDANDPSLYQ